MQKEFRDCIKSEDSEKLWLLLSNPHLDPNIPLTKNGWTALHLACYEGNKYLVQPLVSNKRVKIKLETKQGLYFFLSFLRTYKPTY